MKKILALVVLLAILVTTAASADSLDVEHVDLTSLSFDELTVLQIRIGDEMVKRPEWFPTEIPAGIWVVGEDLPAGKYSIELPDDVTVAQFRVWGAKIGDYSANGGLVYSIWLKESNKYIGKVILEDGYVLELENKLMIGKPFTILF